MDMDETAGLLTRHKLTSDAYYRAAEFGVIGPEDRVELIEGEIIDMAPIGQGHESSVMVLNQALVLACQGRALVSTQNSLRLGQWSAPQPDFAVLRPRADYYATGERAGPADVLLVIEVSESSLRYDRTIKLPLYARSGIGEVWIVDLPHRVLTAHRDPSSGVYPTTTTHHSGEVIALALDPAISVPFRLF